MTDQSALRSKTEALTRLRRVEGQIRGVQRMIEEDRPCEAIATQLMAVRAALDKASLHIMTHHIEACLTAPEGRPERANLDRVISFFLRFAAGVEETSSAEARAEVDAGMAGGGGPPQ